MVHVDTERYRQRRDNGNGTNGNSGSKRSLSGLPSLLALIVTVVTQGIFMVWWVRGESARIDANQIAIENLQSAIYNMNTPLSTRVVRIEGRVEELHPIARGTSDRVQKLEHEVAVIAERQQNIARRLDTITGIMEKGFRLQGEGRPIEPPR